jgi:hypothetical protein
MDTLDLKKQLKHLYNPSANEVEQVEVPAFNFLMVDGAIEKGHEPGSSPQFQENTEAIYGIAYTLKFMLKKRPTDPIDYPVMPLEGLWWVEDGHFDIQVKDNWYYTLMILTPDLVTPELFAQGLAQLRKKRGDQPAFARLRLESFSEGPCIQMMHIGPYATEPATIEKMKAYAADNNLVMHNKHHEIYMGDPRRADPARLKTILRHPVSRLDSALHMHYSIL